MIGAGDDPDEWGNTIEEAALALGVSTGTVRAWVRNGLPLMKARATKTKPVLERLELTPIRRDLAFVVDEAVAAGDVVRHAQGADKQLIHSVDVFDVYQGQGVPEGRKSVAMEVTIQPKEKLKDEDIQALMDKIVAAVAKGAGGVLRG